MPKLTQEDLLEIFERLKKELKPYEQGNIKARMDIQGKYNLWVEKPMEIEGKQRDEVFFAGLIIQGAYVGFYFMPVYVTPDMKPDIAPGLLKQLKGKSCFHIKSTDETLMKEVKDALKKGYAIYKQKGWS